MQAQNGTPQTGKRLATLKKYKKEQQDSFSTITQTEHLADDWINNMYDFHPLSFIFKYFKIKTTMSLFTFSNIHVQQGCAVYTCSDKLGVPAFILGS
jgi:hypothetical protein